MAFEGLVAHGRRCIDEHLLDVGNGSQCHCAAGRRIRGHTAPAAHFETLMGELLVELRPRAIRACRVLTEKHHADGVEWSELKLAFGGDTGEKGVGLLQQQAAAVAGFTVGGDGAPVGEALQRLGRRTHQPVARLIVHLGDQSEAAAVLFEFGRIQSPGWFRRPVHYYPFPLTNTELAGRPCLRALHNPLQPPQEGVATEGVEPIGGAGLAGCGGILPPAGHCAGYASPRGHRCRA